MASGGNNEDEFKNLAQVIINKRSTINKFTGSLENISNKGKISKHESSLSKSPQINIKHKFCDISDTSSTYIDLLNEFLNETDSVNTNKDITFEEAAVIFTNSCKKLPVTEKNKQSVLSVLNEINTIINQKIMTLQVRKNMKENIDFNNKQKSQSLHDVSFFNTAISTTKELSTCVECQFCNELQKDKTELAFHLSKCLKFRFRNFSDKPTTNFGLTVFQILCSNKIKCNACEEIFDSMALKKIHELNTSHCKKVESRKNVDSKHLYCSSCKSIVQDEKHLFELHLNSEEHVQKCNRKKLMPGMNALKRDGVIFIFEENEQVKCLACTVNSKFYQRDLPYHLQKKEHVMPLLPAKAYCEVCNYKCNFTMFYEHLASATHASNVSLINPKVHGCIFCGMKFESLMKVAVHNDGECSELKCLQDSIKHSSLPSYVSQQVLEPVKLNETKLVSSKVQLNKPLPMPRGNLKITNQFRITSPKMDSNIASNLKSESKEVSSNEVKPGTSRNEVLVEGFSEEYIDRILSCFGEFGTIVKYSIISKGIVINFKERQSVVMLLAVKEDITVDGRQAIITEYNDEDSKTNNVEAISKNPVLPAPCVKLMRQKDLHILTRLLADKNTNSNDVTLILEDCHKVGLDVDGLKISGCHATGMALPQCKVDIYCDLSYAELINKSVMNRLFKLFEEKFSRSDSFEDIRIVSSGLAFTHKTTTKKCLLTLVPGPYYKIFFLINQQIKDNPSLQAFLLLVKLWARSAELLGHDKIGMCSLMLLAVYFYRKMSADDPLSPTGTEVIHLFKKFLSFIISFNFSKQAITFDVDAAKNADHSHPICVLNPYEENINIAENVTEEMLHKFVSLAKCTLDIDF